MKGNLSEPSLTEIKSLLKAQFVNRMGYIPDFDNPLSFNEKLNWLKLYDRNPLITICADKYLVRNYVTNKIGSQYLIDLIGSYDSPDEIDFDKLPDRFVIKVNWGSGQNIICKEKNKLDKSEVLAKLNYWLLPENNLYFYSYEWCYKDIKPKIIIEEYIEQADGNLIDYKFFCYNGKVKNLFVASDRHTDLKMNFYDLGWNLYPFTRVYPNDASRQLKPKEFDTMVLLAEKLAENFIFARVDFYILDNNIKFGEITFYPGGGWNLSNRSHGIMNLVSLLSYPMNY